MILGGKNVFSLVYVIYFKKRKKKKDVSMDILIISVAQICYSIIRDFMKHFLFCYKPVYKVIYTSWYEFADASHSWLSKSCACESCLNVSIVKAGFGKYLWLFYLWVMFGHAGVSCSFCRNDSEVIQISLLKQIAILNIYLTSEGRSYMTQNTSCTTLLW